MGHAAQPGMGRLLQASASGQPHRAPPPAGRAVGKCPPGCWPGAASCPRRGAALPTPRSRRRSRLRRCPQRTSARHRGGDGTLAAEGEESFTPPPFHVNARLVATALARQQHRDTAALLGSARRKGSCLPSSPELGRSLPRPAMPPAPRVLIREEVSGTLTQARTPQPDEHGRAAALMSVQADPSTRVREARCQKQPVPCQAHQQPAPSRNRINPRGQTDTQSPPPRAPRFQAPEPSVGGPRWGCGLARPRALRLHGEGEHSRRRLLPWRCALLLCLGWLWLSELWS